jgi:hypothetical protein
VDRSRRLTVVQSVARQRTVIAKKQSKRQTSHARRVFANREALDRLGKEAASESSLEPLRDNHHTIPLLLSCYEIQRNTQTGDAQVPASHHPSDGTKHNNNKDQNEQ